MKLMSWHADKYERLLQVDSIIFDAFGRGCPKYRVNLQHLSILRKKSRMKLGTNFTG